MGAVPPQVQPPFQIPGGPPDEPKYRYLGWTAFLLLLVMMIVLSVSQSDSRSDPKDPDPQVQIDRMLTALQGSQKEAIPILKDVRASQEAARKNSDVSAAVWAESSLLLRERITAQDLAPVRTSSLTRIHWIADILSIDTRKPEDVYALAKKIPVQLPIYRMAVTAALYQNGKAWADATRPLTVPTSSASVVLMLLAVPLVLTVAIATIAYYLISKGDRSLVSLGHPLSKDLGRRVTDALGVRGAMLFGGFIVASLVAEIAVEILVPTKNAGAQPLPQFFALILPTILIFVWMGILNNRPVSGEVFSFKRLRGRVPKLFPLLGWVLGGTCVGLVTAITLGVLGSLLERFGAPPATHPIEGMLADKSNTLIIIGAFILGSVQAPIFEETLFRGILYPGLAGAFSRSKLAFLHRKPWVWAALAQALIFASLHPQGITAWLALGSIGVLNAIVTSETGSIVPAMLIHGIYNGLLMSMALLVR